MMKDVGVMMKDDDFNLMRGFANIQTYERAFVIVELLLRQKIVFLDQMIFMKSFSFGRIQLEMATFNIAFH